MVFFKQYLILIIFSTLLSSCSGSKSEGPTEVGVTNFNSIFDEAAWEKAIAVYKEQTGSSPFITTQNSNDGFKRKPSGALGRFVRKECHPDTLNKRLFETDNLAQTTENFFKDCGDELSQGNSTGLAAILKLATLKYDALSRGDIKPIEIELDDGTTHFGVIALRDERPRPFVIIKCGIFCSGKPASDSLMMFMHLFDEGPFNILFIGNNTGADYMKANKHFSLGGFTEGQDLLRIADWLKNKSKYAHLVSSLHLLGISLGGHASLYAGLYNKQENLFNSVFSYCPAINLEQSFHDLFNSNLLKETFFDIMTWSRAKEV